MSAPLERVFSPSLRARLKRQLDTSVSIGWGVGREFGASILAGELYPLGFVGGSLPVVPRLASRGGQKKPVLFVHGIFHNRSAFTWLKQNLSWCGWRNFKEINLSTSTHSIPEMAAHVRAAVEALKHEYETDQVDLVAHSLGGIVSRYYVQNMEGDGSIRHLITVGTPHRGTPISRLSVLRHIRELSPTSETMQLLNGLPLPQKTQALAISGEMDVFTRPGRAGWWPGVRNIELKRLGHTGLLFSRRVALLIRARLA